MAIYYIDPINGNDANTGTSFAQRWKSIKNISYAAGDDIRVIESSAFTTLGSATWTDTSNVVTLSSAVTSEIRRGSSTTGWTASANITLAAITDTNFLDNAYLRLTPATAFTTGKMAYALTTNTNYSAYQQVSFWFFSAAAADGDFQIKLCSDTTGDTAVHTVNVPAGAGWRRVVFDNGSALSSSIQSIGVYATVDPGINACRINNIFASKAPSSSDALTIDSIISKKTDLSDTFHQVHLVDGVTVTLASYAATKTTLGYSGTTETVTTYVRKPITIYSSLGSLTGASSLPGIDGSPINISGGWNSSDMSTKSGSTAFYLNDTATFRALVTTSGASSFVTINNFTLCGFFGVFNATSTTLASSNILITSCSFNSGANVISCSGPIYGLTVSSCVINNNTASGTAIFAFSSTATTPTVGFYLVGCKLFSNNYSNALIPDAVGDVVSCIFRNQPSVGSGSSTSFAFNRSQLDFYDCTIFSTTLLPTWGSAKSILKFRNCNLDSLTGIPGSPIFSEKEDGAADNHFITYRSGLISSETGADRHTPTGIAWKFEPTRTDMAYGTFKLSIAKIAVAANKTVTVKAWIKRSNTALTMRLLVKDKALNGIGYSEYVVATGAANTYKEETLTFTPTETGVIEIFCDAYGGTTYAGWIDDLTITQAP